MIKWDFLMCWWQRHDNVALMSDKQDLAVETPDEYIELDRTFHELSSYAGESDDIELEKVFHVGQSLGWPNLLDEYRVVILSEAGSGKTEEIRSAARRLRAEGKAAFFLRLEHVASDLEIAFEEGTLDDFNKWLESEDEGWILLDSVDEARLKNPSDFALAIRRVGGIISAAKDRTHIIVTGRTTAWRPARTTPAAPMPSAARTVATMPSTRSSAPTRTSVRWLPRRPSTAWRSRWTSPSSARRTIPGSRSIPAGSPGARTAPSNTPRIRPRSTRTSLTSTSTPKTPCLTCGSPCATWCGTGWIRA